jgi:purine-binding chemotaxis protein CheW
MEIIMAVEDKNNTEVIEENKLVTFLIQGEIYAIDVLRVHEIISMPKIVHVPNSMYFMKGVINLRGKVIPVIDLRLKFNMEAKEYDEITVILIVELKDKFIGIIVDTISDVLDLPEQSIQDTPNFSAKIETDFIRGIGNKDDKLIIVLNIDKILTTDELSILDHGGDAEKK